MADKVGKRGTRVSDKATAAAAGTPVRKTAPNVLADKVARDAPAAPIAPQAPFAPSQAAGDAAEKPAAEMPATAVETAAPIVEAAQSAASSAAAMAANMTQKEEATMATQFDAPKFEAPKMFADLNDRTKAAMEKGSKMFEEMNELAKGNVDALVESSKIAARGFETMGQDAAEYGRRSFEGLTATMKTLASVKSPTEFFKVQGEYVRGAFDAAVAQSSKNTEAMMKLAGDAAQPISSRFAVAAEKAKAAA